MNVVYLHYHLKPGGVSTVIRQQIAALENDCRILVITGGIPPDDFPAPHVLIESLGYDDPDRRAVNPEQTAKAVASAVYNHFPDGIDLIHVHNPLLAKNSNFLKILDVLKNSGFRLILQVHDFAEDGRPGVYYGKQPYPADCHYGVINSRDYDYLSSAGLVPEGMHKLHNMVDPFGFNETEDPAEAFILYPVRALSRKNIGEAALLSLFAPSGQSIAVTLPPNSERDWKIYNRWKNFVETSGLPMVFEASHIHDFKSLISSAHCLLTTSIAEGFGFAFLEPWTAGKALVGRKLPEICKDFEKNGIKLDHLYERIVIPLEWIDASGFKTKWYRCIRDVYSRYGAAMDVAEIDDGYEEVTAHQHIDFAFLDSSRQRQVITRILESSSARKIMEDINPFLNSIYDSTVGIQKILENREAVLAGYNRAAYRQRLLDTYERVKAIKVRHRIDKQRLLHAFLRPESFSLLKWCDDDR